MSTVTIRTNIFGFLSVGLPILFACASGEAQDAQPLRARGAVPPPNLNAIVEAQRAATQVTSLLLKSTPLVRASPPQCSTLTRFDWRDSGKVSPVRDQGACGSCWAFAAIAAYESSYLIENKLTAPPAANPNASEQQALDCSFDAYTCQGGWHDKVFDYLKKPGETTRSSYHNPPYTGAKLMCSPTTNREYTAVEWDFVAGATIPKAPVLKKAICEHGPVVAAVNSAAWDKRLPDKMRFAYSVKQNPNFLKNYPKGVFKGSPSKSNLTSASLRSGDIDHDVLIVGWDDSLKAWIIKNSWGEDWGDNGFVKLSYGTSNIGFNAAWVRAVPMTNVPSAAVLNALSSVHRIKLEKLGEPDKF
jgi:cathepsin L